MTRFDSSGIFGPAHDLPGEDGWFEDLGADDFVDALRSTMREEYADASDEEMGDALTNLLGSMSPAEAINFASALDRIGTSASELASDPTVAAVAGAALPVLGGAAGTLGSGPEGALRRAQCSVVLRRVSCPLQVPGPQPLPLQLPPR